MAVRRRSRGLTGQAFLVVTVALLGLSPVAAAEQPLSGDFEVTGAIRVEGAVRAAADDATFQVLPGAPGSFVLELEQADGALRVVTAVREAVANPFGRGDVWMAPQHDAETLALDGARVRVRDPRPEFLAIATPLEGTRLAMDVAPGARVLALDDRAQAFDVGTGGAYEYYFRHEVPAGSFRFACQGEAPPRLLADAGLQLVLHGALLEVEGADGLRTFPLGDREERDEAGATYRRTSSFAVLALDRADVRLAPGTGAAFHSRSPTLQVDGRLLLGGAEGVLAAGGAAASARGETVELLGTFAVTATHDAAGGPLDGDGTTRLRVQGDARDARIAGKPVLGALLPFDAAPAVAVGAVLLALVLGGGPQLLAVAAAPVYAAATPQGVLANARRRALYDAVLAQPGIHMRDLHRRTGLRWGSLQYHTAVLIGTGLLVAARAGRRTVLACDAHGLAPEQIRAVHLLRGPRAQLVARAVAASPLVTQRDIALRTGVSFRLVSRYLKVMGDLGLVTVQAGGRPKRYASTPRLAELLPQAATAEPAGAWPPA